MSGAHSSPEHTTGFVNTILVFLTSSPSSKQCVSLVSAAARQRAGAEGDAAQATLPAVMVNKAGA